MKVLLTSFTVWNRRGCMGYPEWKGYKPYSIAMYQPDWFPPVKDVGIFKIGDENGHWIRPRNYIGEDHDPTQPDEELLNRYALDLRQLWGAVDKNVIRLQKFIERHQNHKIALLCWCPYDRAARRQMDMYGSFVCHSAVVQYVLENTYDITVLLIVDQFVDTPSDSLFVHMPEAIDGQIAVRFCHHALSR